MREVPAHHAPLWLWSAPHCREAFCKASYSVTNVEHSPELTAPSPDCLKSRTAVPFFSMRLEKSVLLPKRPCSASSTLLPSGMSAAPERITQMCGEWGDTTHNLNTH